MGVLKILDFRPAQNLYNKALTKKRKNRERPKSALYLTLKIVKGGAFGLCETPVGCKI